MVGKLREHGGAVAGVGAAGTLVLGALAWRLAGPAALALPIGLWGPILAGLLMELGRLQRDEAEVRSRQDRAFSNLVTVLQPRVPLPPTGEWAASPDLLCYLTSRILTERPASVVELGSGTSTLCIGYALDRVGTGTLVAVEHHRIFADRTRAAVRAHGLSEHVRVVHAPLADLDDTPSALAWYDLAGVDLPERIDLLFIDGPPRRSGPWARYPALPALRDRLTPASLIVLDDGFRSTEREIVELWQEEFRPARVELLQDMQKGAWVMTGFGAG